MNAPLLLAATTKPDFLVFVVASIAVLIGAIGVVIARHPVHSALMLIQTLFGVAVLFVAQQADFLAAVQVIVYAGAIVVLFLFVIMLVGVDREEDVTAEPLRGQRPVAVALGLAALVELLLLARTHWVSGLPSLGGAADGPGDNVVKLGRSIFTAYLYPFEITSVLLIIAVVGAVVLTRRPTATAGNEILDGDELAASAADDAARASRRAGRARQAEPMAAAADDGAAEASGSDPVSVDAEGTP